MCRAVGAAGLTRRRPSPGGVGPGGGQAGRGAVRALPERVPGPAGRQDRRGEAQGQGPASQVARVLRKVPRHHQGLQLWHAAAPRLQGRLHAGEHHVRYAVAGGRRGGGAAATKTARCRRTLAWLGRQSCARSSTPSRWPATRRATTWTSRSVRCYIHTMLLSPACTDARNVQSVVFALLLREQLFGAVQRPLQRSRRRNPRGARPVRRPVAAAVQPSLGGLALPGSGRPALQRTHPAGRAGYRARRTRRLAEVQVRSAPPTVGRTAGPSPRPTRRPRPRGSGPPRRVAGCGTRPHAPTGPAAARGRSACLA